MQSGARTTTYTTGHINTGYHQRIDPFFLHGNPWNLLRLYHVYRLALAGALLLAMVSDHSMVQLGKADPLLFRWLTAFYLLLAITSNLTSYFEWPDLIVQGIGYVLFDIVILYGFVYSSGGVSSGIGILLIVPVLIPYICALRHLSLLMSSCVGIGLIALEVWISTHSKSGISSSLTHSGILALVIMLFSWMGDRWIQQAGEMANLAKRRGIDLANMSQLNQSILDRLESGIVVVEDSGAIKHMNATAWNLLGNPGNWRSKPLRVFAPELDEHYQHWIHTISPRAAGFDIRHQHTTELRVRFNQLGTQLRRSTLINIEDTSEQREKVQDIKLASLGQLTASIAHEIRNPLGAISHAAQLMGESGGLDKADQRLLQIIQSNTRRMNLTIESVLNLSRKKQPKRENIPMKVWLNTFVQDFILQHKLKPKQVSLFVEPANLFIQFDPAHLHQVMWNICRNAVKYAHDSPDKLQLDIQMGMPSHTRSIILNVIDNGKGISEDDRQRLFEPFFTTSTQGTGLGLFMSRELCLANGSMLDYIDLPTGGSCFRVVFSGINQ